MSELALRLIEENKKTCAKFLDLGNCGLTEVPAEIGELVWLEEITLSHRWRDQNGEWKNTQNEKGPANNIQRLYGRYGEINPFSNLISLKRIWINGDWDTEFDLEDLTPLTGLLSLEYLNVSRTRVADLNPLVGLKGLKELYINETEVEDLTPLAALKGLQRLFIRNTLVTDLAPLKNLDSLVALNIEKTRINDLFPLLPMMRRGIPVVVSDVKDWKSHNIYVKGCRDFTNPPIDIVKQGNKAILNYFNALGVQSMDHLYEAKLLIVGEGGAGKTSLLRRLFQTDKPLPEEAEITKGIDVYRHEFTTKQGNIFRLNVWDFGGQEIYHATHQFFLTKRSLYVLLDDTRKDHKTVQDKEFKYWLEVVDQLSDHSPVLIFQNEKGGRSKTIDEAGIKGRFSNVQVVFRGNLEQKDAADQLKTAVEYYASQLPHIGEELPKLWVTIRADIETLAEQKPYITQKEYFDLYSKYLPFDRTKALHLSRYFHDLGVFLHFQDDWRLAKTVILQNIWATEAVFKMLDDETVKHALGRFTLQDCQRVWQDSNYADMHGELLALMQKFELCYLLPDASPDTWLATQLLPPSKPVQLIKWEQPGDLVLRYRYEFMPKGLISRLMVRLHRFVPQPDLGWVTGVLFERDGSQVLVEIPPEGGEITLRARGPERKELLSVITADLDALNDSFNGLEQRIVILVPCNCPKCRKLPLPESFEQNRKLSQQESFEQKRKRQLPESFEQKRLLQRKRDNRPTVECPSSYENVDVEGLLDGIRVEKLPSWATEDSTPKPIGQLPRIFISYSKADITHKDNLLKHLSGLRDKVLTWHDRDLLPGEEWDTRIKAELLKADIVLYLVSSDSMATNYIQNVELPLIEERCQKGECTLVPVIVRFCDWTSLEFAKYNALPEKGEPVMNSKHWVDEDQAWLKVVEGIKRIV